MSPAFKKRLLQIGSIVLGLGLLYLAMRGVSFASVGEALRDANYWYLLPLAGVTILSHVLRAWRWQLLLDALPEEDQPPERVGLWTAFSAVMIGYMVNYAAPRMGEVARSVNLSANAGYPFSATFGTVVAERVLDVIMLVLGFGLAFVIAARQMAGLAPLLEPVRAFITEPTPATILVLIGIVAVGAGLIYGLRYLYIRAARREGFVEKAASVARAFKDGLLTIGRSRRPVAIVVSTAIMWVCYMFMAYLPLPMLGIAGLGLADAWVLLIMGSAAGIIPAPGGVGSYHYVMIQTMTRLYATPLAAATAYAVLTHAAQLFLYTGVGFACLLMQGQGIALRLSPPAKKPEAETATAEAAPTPPPAS